jgi:hypothetical protein
MLDQLRADFQALPRLLAEALPSFGAEHAQPDEHLKEHLKAEPEPELVTAGVEPDQLDLFGQSA